MICIELIILPPGRPGYRNMTFTHSFIATAVSASGVSHIKYTTRPLDET